MLIFVATSDSYSPRVFFLQQFFAIPKEICFFRNQLTPSTTRLVCFFIHTSTHPFIHPSLHPSIRFILPSILPSVHPPIHSLIHLFTHSIIHPSVHGSFTHALFPPLRTAALVALAACSAALSGAAVPSIKWYTSATAASGSESGSESESNFMIYNTAVADEWRVFLTKGLALDLLVRHFEGLGSALACM